MGRLLCFGAHFNRTHTLSPQSSRRTFFGKLAGLLAAVGIAPSLAIRAGDSRRPATSIALRAETRAVPRKDGTC